MSEYIHIVHEFDPVFDENSKILILGSLPSVKSRENNFYYGHPKNRFWCLMAEIYSEKDLITIEDKKSFLLRNNIALWDVVAECDIKNSSDSSIKNIIPNDLSIIFEKSDIKKVFANGSTAAKIYNKYQKQKCNIDIVTLPSTSPANAVWTYDKLLETWENNLVIYDIK